MIDPSSSRSICDAQRLAGAEDVLLPDELLPALRTHALGERPG